MKSGSLEFLSRSGVKILSESCLTSLCLHIGREKSAGLRIVEKGRAGLRLLLPVFLGEDALLELDCCRRKDDARRLHGSTFSRAGANSLNF